MPDLYAVIGNPVAHSKSPLIHSEFARETAQDLSYGVLFAAMEAFEAEVTRFRAAGGRGLNVTVPFKHRAFALSQRRTPRAEQALSVNTLVFAGEAIQGDTTDGVGLVRDLTLNLQCALSGQRVLLMGAGGASYAVCASLLDQGPAQLVVANRTVEKAVALCEHFSRVHPRAGGLRAARYESLAGGRFDVVINATSAGLAGEMPALPAGIFGSGALGYDMVYGRITPFMAFAQGQGAMTSDGTGMLVEQAAESFHVWRGVRPDTSALIARLRAT